MDGLEGLPGAQMDLGFYQDTQRLSELKNANGIKDKDALKQVASQFESLFLQTMLKNARKTTEGLNEDNPFSSRETQFYQEMLDSQLSSELPQHQGLGIGDLIVKQLSRYLDSSEVTEAASELKPNKAVEQPGG